MKQSARVSHKNSKTVSAAASPTQLSLVSLLMKPLADGLTLGEHLIAGAIATAAAVGVMHPLDTIKTFMQKATVASSSSSSSRSMKSALTSILKSYGISGLFAGVAPNLASQTPAGAVKFTVFELLSQYLLPRVSESQHHLVELFSAASAFLTCSVIIVPGEVLKQRLQAEVYPSLRQGIVQMWSTQGIRGFYQGYPAMIARDVPYTMLEFGLYNRLKAIMRKYIGRDSLDAQQELVLAGVSGGITGFLTTPLDVIKTKLMTQSSGKGEQLMYDGVVDCLRKVVKEDGLKGLFRGSSARTLWLGPFTAGFF
mmetsp:Transcript_7218/g.13008  ORF Transcript_7218/g.13008 Transcript_7218/m.13008 type:complete len:311 (-) Transcript_7218:14-946(-)